ncbi:MAG: hypothetical protein ACK5UX_16045, partial [Burkholderiales bacterium]
MRNQDPPSFPSTDPTLPAFWDDRFAAGFKPWQRANVAPELQQYLVASPRGKVLIPGCGD